MILITGATGRTGKEAAQQLVAKGVKVRALVRNPAKAAALQAAGVELAPGDAGDAAAVRRALEGVSGIAIILPNGESQLALEKQLATLAAEAGVAHIVKVSSVESVPGAPNPVHRTHWESEEHIRSLGKAWTMVRPSFYLQNFLSNAATIKAEGKFYYPFGDKGAAVLTDSRDAGFFVAHVLSTPGHANKSYDITSHELLSFHQIAAVFTQELGRRIEYVPQDPAAYKAFLGRFVTSQWHLDAVCDIFAEISHGYVSRTTNTFAEVTGREPISLAQFIREHIQVFRA
jgi:uncharacterized protein YbjT (DUF2867 family)